MDTFHEERIPREDSIVEFTKLAPICKVMITMAITRMNNFEFLIMGSACTESQNG